MVLLPYNRYLLGCSPKGAPERWVWGRPGDEPRELFPYEDRDLSLAVDGTAVTVLPPKLVTGLRDALLVQTDPPGDHLSAVLILRGLMRENAAFAEGVPSAQAAQNRCNPLRGHRRSSHVGKKGIPCPIQRTDSASPGAASSGGLRGRPPCPRLASCRAARQTNLHRPVRPVRPWPCPSGWPAGTRSSLRWTHPRSGPPSTRCWDSARQIGRAHV